MHHRNAATKLLGHLLEPKLKYNSRIYKGKEIKHDIYTDLNIDITYKQAWRSKNVALESLSGCHVASFAQLPYYCHNLKMINDGTVTHIETDNEDRFKMVFIAFGVVAFAYELQIKGYKLQCLFCKMRKAYLPEGSLTEDYRLAREITRVSGEVNNVVIARAQFLDELNSLGTRHVPAKMAEFFHEIQMKDCEIVDKLQILAREMELNARKKKLFIEKLNGLISY
ncbi:hypothetical protein Tco_0079213 [Tanacetum coccineum]